MIACEPYGCKTLSTYRAAIRAGFVFCMDEKASRGAGQGNPDAFTAGYCSSARGYRACTGKRLPLGFSGAAQVLLTMPHRILIYANRHVAVFAEQGGAG